MPDPSFYYAIFKRLQATGAASSAHINNDNDQATQFYGGFTLKSPDSPYGVFGALGPAAPTWGYQQNMAPLVSGNDTPEQNPLYAILAASLGTPPLPDKIVVNGQSWPVMPPPLNGDISMYPVWLDFNKAGSPRVIDALWTWIHNGKADDRPKSAPLTYAALAATPPAKFPLKPTELTPILFVCSRPGDDGRRAGDHAQPDPPAVQVPAHYWNSAQIFLTDTGGTIQKPLHLQPGAHYYVAAIIGNSSAMAAGRIGTSGSQPSVQVRADALAFNTFMGPNVPLPSLGELDAASTNPIYEQYTLRGWTYDVAGFRFDVDTVFKGLVQAVKALPPAMLGGATAEEWVKDSHPCVKVRIVSGELPNAYTPSDGMALSLESSPLKDRHIAQRNLAPFDMTQMAIKKPMWTKFIVAQAGKGANVLALQHALPLDSVHVHLAVPRPVWQRYLDPRTSRGGAVHGFEPVREALPTPFPDAVVLRQVSAEARLVVADHAHDRFFGMALGLEADPARLRDVRSPEVSMAHAAPDGAVVGGFTVEPSARR
ncbi:MAG: hypothetical protein JSR90_23110 [Proteobacteria bacterium]|nr:hypothetical protein [Pseudomonadota bacterium]